MAFPSINRIVSPLTSSMLLLGLALLSGLLARCFSTPSDTPPIAVAETLVVQVEQMTRRPYF